MVREGDVIAIDGETGEVILDAIERTTPEVSGFAQEFLGWADRYRKLGVRANADTPEDAARARSFGAEGIGLVRTEHMFFATDRIPIVRDMIMAADDPDRRAELRAALDKLKPMQRDDFSGIFRAMDGLPVTIRLLDPPLHEFLANPKEYREMLEESARLDALGAHRRQDRPRRGVLLVRHQRPHAADLRLQPGRGRQVSARLSPEGDRSTRPVLGPRPGGRGRADPNRHRTRAAHAPGSQDRYLRRARRRAVVGGVLSQGRDDVRVLFAVHDSDRAAERGAGASPGARGLRRGRAECVRTGAVIAGRPGAAGARRAWPGESEGGVASFA